MINIDNLLKERKLTKEKLASKMNISRSALYSALNGNPTQSSLEEIARALDVTIADLYKSNSVEVLFRYKTEVYRIPEKLIIKLIEKGEAIKVI